MKRAIAITAAGIVIIVCGCSVLKRGKTPEQAVIVAAYDFRWLASSHYLNALSSYADAPVIARFHAIDQIVWPATDPKIGWAFFFNTAVIAVGGEFNNTIVTAYYNPWSDVALLAAWWAPPGKTPRLIDLDLVMGDFLRRSGKPEFKTSRPWMRKNEYRPVAVGFSTADTVRAFEYFFKHTQPTAAGWRSVMPGLSDAETLSANYYGAGVMFMNGLAELSGLFDPKDDEGKALREKFGRVIDAALAGNMREIAGAPKNTAEAKAALAALRPVDLARFQIAAFIGGKKKSLVILVPPDNPDNYLSLLFAGSGGRWTVERADLLSFRKFYDLGPRKEGN